MQYTSTPALILLTCLAFTAGCSSSATTNTPKNTTTEEGDSALTGSWFCEVGQTNEQWQCIQNQELANNPKPSRLPDVNKSARLDATSTPAKITPTPLGMPVRRPQLLLANNQNGQQTQPKPPTAEEKTTTTPIKSPANADVPKHVRLSYQPGRPVALLDLPPQYWVVQLVSVSDKETLERYAVKHRLRGMSAARIWSKEQFFYVLILGIYETQANAKEASEDLPPPFDEFPPWIRSVGSLQKAIQAADRQTVVEQS